MSCIITTFTLDKIVVSADSAVSSENRTYTGVEKIIPLSNDPPLVIAFYGNSDFCNIPLENIISEYIKKTDFNKINTVKKIKTDFLKFINETVPKNSFEEYIKKEFEEFKKEVKNLLMGYTITQ